VDTGAIKFIMNGSNVMCPGMTSKGGRLEDAFAAGKVVVRNLLFTKSFTQFNDLFGGLFQAIFAEGKEHCMAIGISKMSRDEMYAFEVFVWFVERN